MPIHTPSDIITQIALEQCQFEYPSCFLIPNPDFICFCAKRVSYAGRRKGWQPWGWGGGRGIWKIRKNGYTWLREVGAIFTSFMNSLLAYRNLSPFPRRGHAAHTWSFLGHVEQETQNKAHVLGFLCGKARFGNFGNDKNNYQISQCRITL